MELVKERIGLKKSASGFSLYEVFGPLERNMLLNEKVADSMFKWEKYARSTHSQKTLKLTFKVQLFPHAPQVQGWYRPTVTTYHLSVIVEEAIPSAIFQPGGCG